MFPPAAGALGMDEVVNLVRKRFIHEVLPLIQSQKTAQPPNEPRAGCDYALAPSARRSFSPKSGTAGQAHVYSVALGSGIAAALPPPLPTALLFDCIRALAGGLRWAVAARKSGS